MLCERRRKITYTAGILIIFLLMLFSSTALGSSYTDEIVLRGKVIDVEETVPSSQFVILEQVVEVEVTSRGYYNGSVFTIENVLMDNPHLDIYLEEGKEVLLLAELENGSIKGVYLQEVVRDKFLYYLTAFFLAILILIGGIKGLKTILALGFTVIVILKILLPLILQGYNPIVVSVIFASITAIFTLLIVGGLEKKTFAAIIGTVAGVVTAGLLALLVGNLANLTGFSSEEAQMLMYMDGDINIRGLLFAGIIIGCLGAITDVGISIASAVSEVKRNNPRIGYYSLFNSGMNVGRDIMGTMANTLILAYVGGATPLLLLLLGYEMTWIKIMNLDLIATEIVRSLAGSIGLVVTVPITAIMASLLISDKNKG